MNSDSYHCFDDLRSKRLLLIGAVFHEFVMQDEKVHALALPVQSIFIQDQAMITSSDQYSVTCILY